MGQLMKIKLSRLDIVKTRSTWPIGSTFMPALVEPRSKRYWRVLQAPHLPGNVPLWLNTGADEYVRIPLFQYKLNAKADLALAFMLQLGLSIVGHVSHTIEYLHIVTGDPVELVYDAAGNADYMICWIGFAMAIEKG